MSTPTNESVDPRSSPPMPPAENGSVDPRSSPAMPPAENGSVDPQSSATSPAEDGSVDSRSPATSPAEDYLIEDEKRPADNSFIDDLIAANGMKSHLLSAGYELDEEVIRDLNRLYLTFRSDIEARQAKIAAIMRPRAETSDGSEVDSQ